MKSTDKAVEVSPQTTRTKLAVNHLVYTTTRSFEDVVKAFETVVDTQSAATAATIQ